MKINFIEHKPDQELCSAVMTALNGQKPIDVISTLSFVLAEACFLCVPDEEHEIFMVDLVRNISSYKKYFKTQKNKGAKIWG